MRLRTWDEIRALIGAELGESEWVLISQTMINRFGSTTRDTQFIHVDPVAAAKTDFGGTIAHGFLTLSLLTHMIEQVALFPHGTTMAINHGFDRVRFLAPVRSGDRIRGRFSIEDVENKRQDRWRFTYRVSVEIEGMPRPALVARWLSLVITNSQ
ncbi:MaoC family dehydratase [Sphingopyxis sp. SE2]|uniref:MaoC family dehydratase n=1 Tax=Sphingopyxis sp. SE2 TaxID=1586240 RepID=UPI0028BFEA48|nr:MaoC family dehydratase [Sphingopyxis sp. SE2]MDT7531075.1 MaoC family dehydratase [Sphingopyxis sp. SE2]